MTKKREARQLQKRENLFLLLDENYEKYFDGKEFWRELKLLDEAIKPNCMAIEDYSRSMDKFRLDNKGGVKPFYPREKTITITFPDEQTTITCARLLNDIFMGCNTNFVPEAVEAKGKTTYRMRSNIDKEQWDKLGLFCLYRFEREITDPEERQKFHDESQKVISHYTKNTDSADWKAEQGVPAWVTLMALHGLLRPIERHKPSPKRIAEGLNKPHKHGTPLFFDGVITHVNLKNGGKIECVMMPYDFFFDPKVEAFRDATDRKHYWELLLETFGGNPFDKEAAPSRRAIFGVGLSLGMYGASEITERLIGVVGPAAAAAAGGTVLLLTYVDHKLKFVDRLLTTKKHREERARQKQKATLIECTFEPDQDRAYESPPIRSVVDPIIHEAYLGKGGNPEHMVNAVDGRSILNHAIQAIIENGSGSALEVKAEHALHEALDPEQVRKQATLPHR